MSNPETAESADSPVEESLHRPLARLLNIACRENASDTPDFILAQFMLQCLIAFEQASNERRAWHGEERAEVKTG
jgi:hypothetical protein